MDVVDRVDARTHAMTFIAEDGTAGVRGDGGSATDVEFESPSRLAIDADCNLYVPDGARSASVASMRRLESSPRSLATG